MTAVVRAGGVLVDADGLVPRDARRHAEADRTDVSLSARAYLDVRGSRALVLAPLVDGPGSYSPEKLGKPPPTGPTTTTTTTTSSS